MIWVSTCSWLGIKDASGKVHHNHGKIWKQTQNRESTALCIRIDGTRLGY